MLDLERRGIGVVIDLHHARRVAATSCSPTAPTTLTLQALPHVVLGARHVRVEDGRIVLWDDAFGWGSFLGGSLVGLGRAGCSAR